MARSWARGQQANVHQPRSPHIEAARHLRLTVTRYINDRASLSEVEAAMVMLRAVAPVPGDAVTADTTASAASTDRAQVAREMDRRPSALRRAVERAEVTVAMARLEDKDGIDGPFERGMRRAMREDREAEPLTADTITDEQIRELRVAVRNEDPDMHIRGLCAEALREYPCQACDHRASKGLDGQCPSCAHARSFARRRCAEILEARRKEGK